MRHVLGLIATTLTALPAFASDAPETAKGLVYRQGTFFVVDHQKPAPDLPKRNVKNDAVKVDVKLLESIYGQSPAEEKKQ